MHPTFDTPPAPASPAALPPRSAPTNPLATVLVVCAITFLVLTLVGSISGWQQATPVCSSDGYDDDGWYESDGCTTDLLDRLPGVAQAAGPWAIAFVGSLVGVAVTGTGTGTGTAQTSSRTYEF